MRFQVKPLSANKMWGARGKRTFKSKEYIEYQNEIRDELMGTEWEFGTDKVNIFITAGLSNRGADIDNVIKPVLDTYQSIYPEFNDNKVYWVAAAKDIVQKGEEYLYVEIYANKVS